MPKGIYKHSLNQGFQKGHKKSPSRPWNKGKEGQYHFPNRKRIGLLTEEHKRKIGKTIKKKYLEDNNFKEKHFKSVLRGNKCFLWNGGISFKPYTIDWTKTLKKSIRERDNYTCQICGLNRNFWIKKLKVGGFITRKIKQINFMTDEQKDTPKEEEISGEKVSEEEESNGEEEDDEDEDEDEDETNKKAQIAGQEEKKEKRDAIEDGWVGKHTLGREMPGSPRR